MHGPLGLNTQRPAKPPPQNRTIYGYKTPLLTHMISLTLKTQIVHNHRITVTISITIFFVSLQCSFSSRVFLAWEGYTKCSHSLLLLLWGFGPHNFLRQDLFSRLVKCQLAIPFLMPDPYMKQLVLPLWSMRSIFCDWTTTEGERWQHYPVLKYPMPIVSFIRFGDNKKVQSQSQV